jgi:uncharacterized protein
MAPPTKVTIDPKTHADRRIIEADKVALTTLERLRSIAESDQGELEYSLEFGRSADREIVIGMDIKYQMQLRCQRCLETFDYAGGTKVTVAVATNDLDASKLEENYDTVIIVDESGINITELVEDEALLSMPLVSAHASEDECVPQMLESMEDSVVIEEPVRVNPFAALASLKKD